jgi:hypothetical protein
MFLCRTRDQAYSDWILGFQEQLASCHAGHERGCSWNPKALTKIDDLESLIYNFEETYPKFKQLVKSVGEFRTYIVNNGHLIPNYGERYRNGEAIATGFAESANGSASGSRCSGRNAEPICSFRRE